MRDSALKRALVDAFPDFGAWMTSLWRPGPAIVASNGLTFDGLHRLWPNLFGNQIVGRCDR
jgi:hypothetical protein